MSNYCFPPASGRGPVLPTRVGQRAECAARLELPDELLAALCAGPNARFAAPITIVTRLAVVEAVRRRQRTLARRVLLCNVYTSVGD